MRWLSAIISQTPRSLHSSRKLFSTPRPSFLLVRVMAPTPVDAAEDTLRKDLAHKQSTIQAQADTVRGLKASGASKPDIDAAVRALNALKLEKASIETQLQAAVSGGSANRDSFRQALVNTLERRLFYIPSFKIYGGVAGLYDYGPPGCAIKSNVLGFWRQVSYISFSISSVCVHWFFNCLHF